jgi:glycosyltransferase involved in cell wall biosynthesis
MNPKISIITITRNRAGFIAKAIESAQSQTFTDWELIISDDDSNDNTEAIVDSYKGTDSRIKYYKNSPALGISGNRNKALSLASGKYIAVLDSDDFWTDKDKLQKQYDFLEKNPDYVLIGSNIKIIDEKGNFIKKTTFKTEDKDIRKKILIKNQFGHSSVLIKKEILDKIGGYNESMSGVEDLDSYLRLGKFGKIKNLSEITTSYTKHCDGITYSKKTSLAWKQLIIVLKNFNKYPNWFLGMAWAKLRLFRALAISLKI